VQWWLIDSAQKFIEMWVDVGRSNWTTAQRSLRRSGSAPRFGSVGEKKKPRALGGHRGMTLCANNENWGHFLGFGVGAFFAPAFCAKSTSMQDSMAL